MKYKITQSQLNSIFPARSVGRISESRNNVRDNWNEVKYRDTYMVDGLKEVWDKIGKPRYSIFKMVVPSHWKYREYFLAVDEWYGGDFIGEVLIPKANQLLSENIDKVNFYILDLVETTKWTQEPWFNYIIVCDEDDVKNYTCDSPPSPGVTQEEHEMDCYFFEQVSPILRQTMDPFLSEYDLRAGNVTEILPSEVEYYRANGEAPERQYGAAVDSEGNDVTGPPTQ